MKLRPAEREDMPAIRALLAGADLPVDDVDAHLDALWVATESDELLGVVGLEVAGATGLLRSLAVAPRARGRRIARALCDRVFEDAARRSLTALYLLTTDADGYFARLGFEAIDREDAPQAIRATREFAELCPGSAILMRRAGLFTSRPGRPSRTRRDP